MEETPRLAGLGKNSRRCKAFDSLCCHELWLMFLQHPITLVTAAPNAARPLTPLSNSGPPAATMMTVVPLTALACSALTTLRPWRESSCCRH